MNTQTISQETLEQFRCHLQKKGLSENTILVYTPSLRQYLSLFPDFGAENLQAYRQFLLSHYQINTVNTKIHGINSYLHSQETASSPHLLTPWKIPPIRTQTPSFLDNVISRQDYELLKQSLKRDRNMFWYFVVRFLAATGARVSELVQIRLEYLKPGYMDLYSKGGKVRRIYFPRSLCREALSWFQQQGIESGFIFLSRLKKPISTREIRRKLKQLAYQYGINPDTMYPHSFRHLFARNFLEQFDDIALLADLLGHESIDTTRIYLTRSNLEQKELIDRIITW